jgi:hypothetical protein
MNGILPWVMCWGIPRGAAQKDMRTRLGSLSSSLPLRWPFDNSWMLSNPDMQMWNGVNDSVMGRSSGRDQSSAHVCSFIQGIASAVRRYQVSVPAKGTKYQILIFHYSYIHMCIHWVISPSCPCPLAIPYTPSLPSRTCSALLSNFVQRRHKQ